MNYPNLSVYKRIHDIESTEVIPIDIFFENIREGAWQDIVIPIRAIKDKKQRDELKKRIAPSVTLSGTFATRYDDKIIQHSEFIGVDIDDLGANVEAFKAMVAQDKYTYAVFTSISGYGVCIVVRIDPDHHRDAYMGLAKYYLERYKIVVDPTGLNKSRARFISFDPHMYLNEKSETFKKYLPKEKKVKPPPVVFVQTEFDDVVRQIVERGVNCCEDYRDWLKVCFALCNRFGEGGRSYFHQLSGISAKYDPAVCDKQYSLAMAHEDLWSGNKATLSTIYYYAKLAGINIASEKTKKITAATSSMKKAGLSKDQIIGNLEKFEGIGRQDCEHIVGQAFDSGHSFHQDGDTMIDNVILWLRSTYALRRNGITLRIENGGVPITDPDLNTMFLNCKKVFDDINFQLFKQILDSNFTPTYNPFAEWWEFNQDRQYNDEIMKFWRCIDIEGDWDRMVYFGNKWLVALVSCIHYKQRPLVLTFTGPIGKGKTEIFRQLLPDAWRHPVDYYAESSTLGNGKDDDILMTQKILVVDDEFGGMGKREERKFKAVTDKQVFSIRRPYGHGIEDLRRLCLLGATCNEDNVLSDTSGNRRILPFKVKEIDWEAINMIDRNALWAEVFRWYYDGFDCTIVKGDIAKLAEGNDDFIDYSMEHELLQKYYELPTTAGEVGIQELSASVIKEYIDRMSGQRTNVNKIGQELKLIGFRQAVKKINGRTARVYLVIEKRVGILQLPGASPPPPPDLEQWKPGFDTGHPF
jgi:hypothetical protein